MPSDKSVDLRSDTVTKPGAAMRSEMAEAEVGDDVFGEDPTVNALEARAAELLGKEMAVFFPSGTQSNLSAILTHCQRGDEMLVGDHYHSFHDEAGGASALGGVAYSTLPVQEDGSLDRDHITAAVRSDDPHYPRTRLLCLENTTSGRAVPTAQLSAAAETAREFGLRVHLDGARLFNAAAELKETAACIASVADTVSVCLSKGLGAPAGTILAGRGEFEYAVRRNRKILGGGMRQAGVIAAAGLYALNNNITRLAEDHGRAARLADELSALPQGSLAELSQATNMVFVTPHESDLEPLHRFLARRGVMIGNRRPTMRIVFHLGITDEGVTEAANAFREFFENDHSTSAQ
ncbi:MAG: low-specificity L-threonine aldolase [Rhodobacteraceae bacterium]|nr:low-specificity L-threonine aldolase [Paracoccaceae bacterium]